MERSESESESESRVCSPPDSDRDTISSSHPLAAESNPTFAKLLLASPSAYYPLPSEPSTPSASMSMFESFPRSRLAPSCTSDLDAAPPTPCASFSAPGWPYTALINFFSPSVLLAAAAAVWRLLPFRCYLCRRRMVATLCLCASSPND